MVKKRTVPSDTVRSCLHSFAPCKPLTLLPCASAPDHLDDPAQPSFEPHSLTPPRSAARAIGTCRSAVEIEPEWRVPNRRGRDIRVIWCCQWPLLPHEGVRYRCVHARHRSLNRRFLEEEKLTACLLRTVFRTLCGTIYPVTMLMFGPRVRILGVRRSNESYPCGAGQDEAGGRLIMSRAVWLVTSESKQPGLGT